MGPLLIAGAVGGALSGIFGHRSKIKAEKKRIRRKRSNAKLTYAMNEENTSLSNLIAKNGAIAQLEEISRDNSAKNRKIATQLGQASGTVAVMQSRGVGSDSSVQAALLYKGLEAKHAEKEKSQSMINRVRDSRSNVEHQNDFKRINAHNKLTASLADQGWVDGSYLSSAFNGAIQGAKLGAGIAGAIAAPDAAAGILQGTKAVTDSDLLIYNEKKKQTHLLDYRLQNPGVDSYFSDGTQLPSGTLPFQGSSNL